MTSVVNFTWVDQPNVTIGNYTDFRWAAVGVLDITGNSSVSIGVSSEGFGELEPAGISDITVSVTTSGDGAILIVGNSTANVSVSTTGTAEFSSWPEILGDGATPVTVTSTGTAAYDIFGDSTQTVTVTSTGTGVRQIDGNSSYTVSVATTGTGLKSIDGIDGNGTNVLVTVLSSGTGVWTGGPEIFGTEGNTAVNLFVTGAGRIVNPIYGEANNTITVSSVGGGTSQYIYVDIIGQGSSLIDVFTYTDGEVVSNTRDVYLIDKISHDYTGVSFEVYMLVDIDKKTYEIHSIKTNKPYLQDFRRFKWTKTMELGTVIKDEISLIEEPSDSYKTERLTTIRKYGVSEVKLTINITDTYRFIKNEVNIAKLIDREVTRALLDTYALYELEFE